MKTSSRRLVLTAVLVLAVGGGAAYLLSRPEPPDTRFSGTYRLDDGGLVFVTPSEGDVLRYRRMSGESRALRPTPSGSYEAGPGWAGSEPVEVRLEFEQDISGAPSGFEWTHPEGGRQRAAWVDQHERIVRFDSDTVSLRGKLVLPPGQAPHPAVVLVHGSEDYSAVDYYFEPYLFAANGVAGFAFDKRGTGESQGKYTQYFPVLAQDVAAAVEFLRKQPEIDGSRIHLAGYSQGGWVAPLAATLTPEIRSLLIAYGPLVPVSEEDRWGYVYALREAGLGEAEIAEADRINVALSAIIDQRENRWAEVERLLEAAEGEAWLEAVKGSDSQLGFVAGTKLPLWVVRLVAWWNTRPRETPTYDRLYDPVPTLAALDVPSLWVFGGRDHSMPTEWTVEALDRLREAGRPIQIRVFPEADHGLLVFDEDAAGGRTPRGYAEGYLPLEVGWLRQQSGLGVATPADK